MFYAYDITKFISKVVAFWFKYLIVIRKNISVKCNGALYTKWRPYILGGLVTVMTIPDQNSPIGIPT